MSRPFEQATIIMVATAHGGTVGDRNNDSPVHLVCAAQEVRRKLGLSEQRFPERGVGVV